MNKPAPASLLNNSSILITGGTGSFGTKFVETVLANFRPKRLVVFSRDEFKQFEMQKRFPVSAYPCMRYFIGDVRDRDRLRRALSGIEYVIHAAALKQVPTAEYNPTECIRTNITGAENLINAAVDEGVKKVIALSTDKAVAPVNLYGATKLCSDKLFVAANSYTGSRTAYSVVRYGNVMGSRGSVIPLFISQRESGGPITITDRRMTRFWLTIDSAVNMVIKAMALARGGEIFVPKIPSMRIMDLAEAIAPGMEMQETGIRPGEKLHESMITPEDARHTVDIKGYFVILPEVGKASLPQSAPVPEDFCYASNTNTEWLSVEQMRSLIASFLQKPTHLHHQD